MKSKLLKSLLFFFVICALSVLTVFSASAKTVTKNKLVYEVKGKTATLVDCKSKGRKVTVPAKIGKYKVTVIGEWAFSGKKKLRTVNLPSTITKIGKAAFNECTSLKKIVIPSSVKKINAAAFWYCTNLETVVIPKSVKTIGKSAFEGCDKLTAFVVKGSMAEKYFNKQSKVPVGYLYMTSLVLSSTSVEIEKGESVTLTVTKKPAKLYNGAVVFSSDNTAVAQVSKDGVITAKKAGKAVITCIAQDGSGKKAQCVINVVAKKAADTVPVTPDNTVSESPSVKKVLSLKVSDNTVNGYTLSWEGSAENTGYIVSRYNSVSKLWANIADTKDTSLVITDRPLGSKDDYRVTAYIFRDGKNIYAEPSVKISAQVLTSSAVKDVKVTAVTENSIALSWPESENATGYKIYLYDSATKQYTYKWATEETETVLYGLDSACTYVIAVKSYVASEKESLECESFSDTVSATTLPGRVEEIFADAELIYPDNITLSWNEVAGADGYNVYLYSKEKGDYELYGSTTELYCQVNNLTPDTEYFFKIRVYSIRDNETIESLWSDAYSFTSAYIPQTSVEAAQSFIDSLNATKNRDDSFLLARTFSVKEIEGENLEEIESITSLISQGSTELFDVENGADTVSGQTACDLIYPFGDESDLSVEDIDTQNLIFTPDGYGFNMEFTVNSDEVSEIVCPIDFDAIAEKNEGFTLISLEYGNADIQVKTDGETISWMKINVPVTAVFSFGGEKYEISYMLSQNYLFT